MEYRSRDWHNRLDEPDMPMIENMNHGIGKILVGAHNAIPT